jgi:hypothetical protein
MDSRASFTRSSVFKRGSFQNVGLSHVINEFPIKPTAAPIIPIGLAVDALGENDAVKLD